MALNKSDYYKIFAALRLLDVAKVVVEFSGGNDEGGADSTQYYAANGNRLHISDSEPLIGLEDFGTLEEVVYEPIEEKYSSFNGDFSVSGVLEWNVDNETVSLSGSESVESYESIDDDIYP